VSRFFRPPSKYPASKSFSDAFDEEDEFDDEDDTLPEDDDAEDSDVGEVDEDDILDSIRRGEYKPKKKDPWTWHCLYSTCRDLDSLNRNTNDISRGRSDKKR